jgi:hypothetical protein
VDKKSLAHQRALAEKPRTADCAGCRVDHPRRLLVTVPEGPFDDLPFLDGDRGCRPCAKRAACFFESGIYGVIATSVPRNGGHRPQAVSVRVGATI